MNATELQSKTNTELVAIYNAIPGVTPTKKFSTKDAGIKRILRALSADSVPVVNDSYIEETPVLDKEIVVEVTMPKTRPGPKTDEPGTYNEEPLEKRVHPRKSKRADLAAALRDGATYSDLVKEFVPSRFANEKLLHKTIRILHWWNGYGLSTDENGKITLVD